jgi:type VI secretion system protein VasJ
MIFRKNSTNNSGARDKIMDSDIGKRPVSSAAPAGSQVRSDPRFDDLQAEIDAMTAISSAPRAVDWDKVIALAGDLLLTQGKDLLVACWLGAGLARKHGVAGIGLGATVMADMCAVYWENLHPPLKRLNARLNALNWWQEQVEAWLTANESNCSRDLYLQAIKAVERLNQTMAGRYDGSELRIGSLSRRLRELAERAAAPPPAKSGAQEPPPSPAAAPALGQEALSPGQTLAQCLDMCRQAADALLPEDAANPASYILRRAALWSGLGQMPPSQGKRTLLPAPPSHILPGLRQMLARNDFLQALGNAEAQAEAFIYWLDLSACSASALAALGESHLAALRALEGQVSALMSRFPQLADLAFEDGTPFADPETRDWLARIAAKQLPEESASDDKDKINRLNRLPPLERINALQNLLPEEGRGRGRLAIYSAVCQAARDGKFWDLLLPLGRHILEIIETHKLADFDPELTAEILLPLLAALRAAAENSPAGSPARECLQAVSACLCRLRPREVLF